ncbi:protein 5NUC-like [Schistocerca cancellata]|uniref:protein 5NUC-like n=1 Tax=Schistocerca cancellata TaxID=274614 RepID=UPI00211884A6|nr:protein 5NUC-like [Schistocerca cancellata]
MRSPTAAVAAVALWLCLAAAAAAPAGGGGDVSLTLLHTNDMHARFEQTSRSNGKCRRGDERHCYGGFARVAHVVRGARSRAAQDATAPHVLFLVAGDTYQGTVWFTVHKWRIVAAMLNLLQPNASSLGNHEFDNGVAGLVPFLENASFPVVAANLDTSEEPALAASPLVKSVVLHLPGGPDVGIIGYLTPETKIIAFTGKVKFLDEVASIKEEAERLKREGINILIALGHSGYKTDQRIASEVPDIDVVIGGHTNTFLYTGDAPDSEVPVDLYPKIITQPSGKKVPVVQAYAYTKYLGNLTVVFDQNGELKSFTGNPVLLNSSVEEDSEILKALEEWRAEVDNSTKEIIGKTRVLLDGAAEHCRLFECNLGNLVTDAMVYTNAKSYHGNGWTNAPIALFNGGGIRSSIDTSSDGNVTKEDILTTLPFQNTLFFEKINGSQLLAALENGVYYYEEVTTRGIGSFPQLSGLKVTYNIKKPAGARVQEVLVLCGECRVPTYSPLIESDIYGVIIPAFMKQGGDNYKVFENSIESSSLDYIDSDIVADYIKQKSPVYPAIEDRISFETDTPSHAIRTRSTILLHYTLTAISIYCSVLM